MAAEVKKGMGQKVKNGGTIGRAPLGYLNVRRVDEKGREERTVVLDEERAPLIKLAFEEYATGNWTVAALAEHLAACGLTTRATSKIPSVPINEKALHKIMVNPYYKGVTTYQGVEQAGRHEPIVSPEVWDKVQRILASHLNGERTRQHPHFLKSSVYCAACGSRLIISNERKKNGLVYPYFVCAGRHSKRVKDCKMRAVLVDVIERKIEEIYDNYQIPSELKATLESYLLGIIERDKQKADTELAAIGRQKNQLEHRRKKLLEAQLAELQDELDQTQQDHAYDVRDQGYQNLSDSLNEQLNDTLDNIKYNSSEQERVISEMLNHIVNNYADAYDKINQISYTSIRLSVLGRYCTCRVTTGSFLFAFYIIQDIKTFIIWTFCR